MISRSMQPPRGHQNPASVASSLNWGHLGQTFSACPCCGPAGKNSACVFILGSYTANSSTGNTFKHVSNHNMLSNSQTPTCECSFLVISPPVKSHSDKLRVWLVLVSVCLLTIPEHRRTLKTFPKVLKRIESVRKPLRQWLGKGIRVWIWQRTWLWKPIAATDGRTETNFKIHYCLVFKVSQWEWDILRKIAQWLQTNAKNKSPS